jgi:hypothetical protein
MEHTEREARLITPEGCYLLSDQDINRMGIAIFPCGKCSTDAEPIYHNVLGIHRHRQRGTQ